MSVCVLLRGLTREARHWADLPGQMRAAGIEGEFVCVDLPGCGMHVRVKAPANVRAMLAFVRADLASRGHRPPFRIIGLSLGAMVAVAWAQNEPAEVEALIVINTSMRPFNGLFKRLRPGAWPGLVSAALHWRGRRRAESAIHDLTCNRCDKRDTDLAVWIAIYRSSPVNRANALRQFWAAARFRARAEAPRCPVLVLSSQGDRLVHPQCSAALAKAWHAAHREHPWAGHDLPHDDAMWIVDAVARWLDEPANAFQRSIS